jgi:hypothetical protein
MIRRLVPAIAAVLSLAAVGVMAQSAPGVKKACAADMRRLCPDITDPHAARQCMRSHMAEVSPDCHAAIEAMKAARAAQRSATAPAAAGPPPPGAPH